MNCKLLTINGNESVLFKTLLTMTNNNESEATALHSYFSRPSFIEDFGDYVNDYTNNIKNDRIDANGEPLLFKNDDTDSYYYINKDGERKLFPPNESPILSLLDGQTVRTVAHYLGMSYLQETRNVNLENFDLATVLNNVSLRDFIKSKIADRIKELENSEDFEDIMQASLLESVQEHSSDLVPYIQDFYKTLMIEFNENVETSNDEFYAEESRDAGFGRSSNEFSTTRNMKTSVKVRLATLKDPNGFNPLFGDAYIDFSKIDGLLKEALNDNYAYVDANGQLVDIGVLLTERLEKLASKRPELVQVVDTIRNNSEFLADLVASFKNQRNNILSTQVDTVLDANDNMNVQVVERNNSDNASFATSLRRTWNSAFYTKLFGDNVTVKDANQTKILLSNIKDELSKFKTEVNKLSNTEYLEQHGDVTAKLALIFEDHFGIDVSPLAIQDLFESVIDGTAMKTEMAIIADKLSKDIDTVLSRVNRIVSNRVTSYDLITHSDTLRKISKQQAIRSDAQSDLNIMAGGKRLYIMSNINYLKDRIEVWKRAPHLLLEYYNNSSAYQKSSEFMKFLTAQDLREADANSFLPIPESRYEEAMRTRLNNMSIGVLTDLFVVNDGYKSDTSAITESSISDYILMDVNKVLTGLYFRTTTQADRSSNYQIKLPGYTHNAFGGLNFQNNLYHVEDKTVTVFEKYLESEIARMVEAGETINNIEEAVENNNEADVENKKDIDFSKIKIHYHYDAKGGLDVTYNEDGSIKTFKVKKRGNAFKSQLLPGLNFIPGNAVQYKGTNLRKLEISRLEQEIRSRLYEHDENSPNYGNLKESLINDASKKQGFYFTGLSTVGSNGQVDLEMQSLVRQYMRMALSDRIQSTYRDLIKHGVIELNNMGQVQNIKVDTEYLTQYSQNNAYTRRNNTKDTLAAAVATEYTVRSMINNIEYSKLFTGDLAYYKDMIDYKKRVPATYTDGLTMYINDTKDLHYNIAVIDSVELKSFMHDAMVQTYGENVASNYNNINSADAQAWITPERWKFIMQKLRKWTPTHDLLYNKMMSGNKETYTNDELKIAASPVKGVHFSVDNTTGAPTYLKYSQAVLTPQLVKGTPLQKVYDNMMEQGVDELITLDGVKVGSPVTTKLHNADGSIIDNYKFNKLQLSNLNWKMQQDLPVKTFKDTEVGSQIQKNIFAGLVHNPTMEFEYDGKIVTGKQIMDEIYNEIKALSDSGLNKFMKDFSIDPTTHKINNVDKFYSSIIDELKSRDGSKNVINALEKRMSIAGIPQARVKLDQVFASIVTKRIVKIKTNGGSFVQMSNFGLNFNEATANDSGIILHPNFKHLVNRTTGGNIDNFNTFEPTEYIDAETGRKRISPGGIFISGSFIAKYIPNYKDYSNTELFGAYDENGQLVEEGMIDRRILEGLIGYRIPNQGLASNDALQIVGILPEENGDTVVAYTGITTKTGSD